MTLPFDRPEALALNEARMSHVKSLGIIQPGMRVLDVGAGVGHLSKYLLDWGCEVVALEGRKTNVEEARRRYPGLDIRVCDIDKEYPHLTPEFDVVLMFGVLYHLMLPIAGLGRVLRASQTPLVLLSTVVTDSSCLERFPVNETNGADQSMNGFGCRPSPNYIKHMLHMYDYEAHPDISQPDHPAYQWLPAYDGKYQRGGGLLRQFFIFERSK
jgi:SAM-dependent methyltransferase